MRILVWFRRDLRCRDHRALAAAARAASRGVVGVFLSTPRQWELHADAQCKVDFWRRNLVELERSLEKLGIPLRVADAGDFAGVPDALERVLRETESDAVYCNAEYEVYERRRDEAVVDRLGSDRVRVFDDRYILPPGSVLTKEGRPYSVFTAFKKAWVERARESTDRNVLRRPRAQEPLKLDGPGTDAFEAVGGECRADLWPAGEDEAQRRLRAFSRGRGGDYGKQRDLPAVNGTSLLSPYLAAGVLSARECLHAALDQGGDWLGDEGGLTTWISELIWRDFYGHVLVAHPRVSMHQPYIETTRAIRWADDPEGLAAWKEGRTGFPLVDAAQRQLLRTGWMHNRLRMVSAMFLSKDLFVDWRLGEEHFMRHLIDGDLAANNGGWQWSSSTGTDAAPYFRIFNPFSQSKRFDPDGEFIRKFCPELEPITSTRIHDPTRWTDAERAEVDYPEPILDHASARRRALAVFKKLKN